MPALEGKVAVITGRSAGIFDVGTFPETTPEQFDRTFDINVRGLFFAVQKALPLMTEGGSII